MGCLVCSHSEPCWSYPEATLDGIEYLVDAAVASSATSLTDLVLHLPVSETVIPEVGVESSGLAERHGIATMLLGEPLQSPPLEATRESAQ
jgi:hypothetical protein